MADSRQDQRSQQSMGNPAGGKQKAAPADEASAQDQTGIGSSQGQDRAGRGKESGSRDRTPRTGEGTADIERDSVPADSGGDSLVNDPTGAFKERP